jgi:hypothetical protein
MPYGSSAPESLADFRLVEFAARRRPGFRNCVVPLRRVPALVRRFGAYGCYATFYLYDEEIRRHAREHAVAGRPSVAGYDGPVFAPVWPLDIDDPDLENAVNAVRETRRRLCEGWGIPEAAVRFYFSGKKGFHVTVDTRAFVAPHPSRVMPEVLHRLTRRLAGELSAPAGGSLDLSLRDRVRLLRLPNTRHEETGLFKIPLTASEVEGLGPAEIRLLAREVRPLEGVDPTGLVAQAEVARGQRPREIFEEAAARRFPLRAEPRSAGWQVADPAVLRCPARLALLGGVAPEGQRNNTAIRLISWFREAGLDREDAELRLSAWNAGNPTPLDENEVRHVVDSAYAHPEPYHYGCRDSVIEPHCPVDPAARGGCPYHRGGDGGSGDETSCP